MKRFRLTADALFKAENIDDALRRLGEHFLARSEPPREHPDGGAVMDDDPPFFLAESRVVVEPEGVEPP